MIETGIEIRGKTEAVLNEMMAATGQDIETVLRKAVALYLLAAEADATGKTVGIAATEDGPVETVLTGFR